MGSCWDVVLRRVAYITAQGGGLAWPLSMGSQTCLTRRLTTVLQPRTLLGVEAGFRPERTIAGVALLLAGALAGVTGVLALVAAPILGFGPPDVLETMFATVVGLLGFGIVSVVLAAMTLAGWHAQLSLAAATALLVAAAFTLGPDRLPGGWFLPAVGILNAAAFLAGAVRRYRG
jgi:hypothetical protein